jgi:large subunit ribosomal protein L15
MKLHTLRPAKGATHKQGKRVGRGEGSGKGGTSTRGHKGAGSRSGTSTKRGFEGGQMPLYRRIPKFGFKNLNRIEFVPVNLDRLQKLSDEKGLTTIDFQTFLDNGFVSKNGVVKVLGRGELKSAIQVKAHAFSATAIQAIEAAGGKAEII